MDIVTIIDAVSSGTHAVNSVSAAIEAIDINAIPHLDVHTGLESLVPSADLADWYRQIVGLFSLPTG